mmetsp:Transcript_132424/g.255049  ORF Transcript_132424/g.255049 Transcript_132424/m.255049 type:complete len:271 (-) Transcript_132424:962-1774(-)
MALFEQPCLLPSFVISSRAKANRHVGSEPVIQLRAKSLRTLRFCLHDVLTHDLAYLGGSVRLPELLPHGGEVDRSSQGLIVEPVGIKQCISLFQNSKMHICIEVAVEMHVIVAGCTLGMVQGSLHQAASPHMQTPQDEILQVLGLHARSTSADEIVAHLHLSLPAVEAMRFSFRISLQHCLRQGSFSDGRVFQASQSLADAAKQLTIPGATRGCILRCPCSMVILLQPLHETQRLCQAASRKRAHATEQRGDARNRTRRLRPIRSSSFRI